MPNDIPYPPLELITRLAQRLVESGRSMVTAESCTGGMVAAACTALAGSSQWFDCAMVTYSNEAKMQMLGVPEELIAEHGAVSEAVARAMAEGALWHSRAHVSLAITGIAGPGGGSAEKPVGTVWFGWASRSHPDAAIYSVRTQLRQFEGSRQAIREAACAHALRELLLEVEKG